MPQPWNTLLTQAIEFRHELHQNPELTWEEVQTAEQIRHRLDLLAIPWRTCAQTGTLATLAPQAKGKHIALRGDIDALPIEEATDLAYKSLTPGKMHACGHDGHTAALWATAAWLKQHEAQLSGPVTLIFQPAEEGGHGAKAMIEDGALEGIDAIYGWHNWPNLNLGQAVCPNGAVMAGNGSFVIEVEGKGGHASQPENCQDPLLAAAAITLNLQQVVSRRLPPQASAVLSVTSLEAPSAVNVIRQNVQLKGGIRFTDANNYPAMAQAIQEISESTAHAYHTQATVKVKSGYPATINHATEAHTMRQALAEELGANWLDSDYVTPIMGSEDFSYYLQQVPGCFALIGSRQTDEQGELCFHHACHHPSYQFNDALIETVVRLFSRLVGAPLPD